MESNQKEEERCYHKTCFFVSLLYHGSHLQNTSTLLFVRSVDLLPHHLIWAWFHNTWQCYCVIFVFIREAIPGLLHPPLHCPPIPLLVRVTLQHWALQKSHTGIVAVFMKTVPIFLSSKLTFMSWLQVSLGRHHPTTRLKRTLLSFGGSVRRSCQDIFRYNDAHTCPRQFFLVQNV